MQKLSENTLPEDMEGKFQTTLFGGKPRAAISSLAWGKGMSDFYKNTFKDEWEQENLLCRNKGVKPGIGRVLFGKHAANEPERRYRLPRYGVPYMSYVLSTHSYSDDQSDPVVYRYGVLSVAELSRNLESEDVRTAVSRFTQAFIKALPNGKEGADPEMVYITLTKNMPCNMMVAFERPVGGSEDGYLRNSLFAFNQYIKEICEDYEIEQPKHAWYKGDLDRSIFGQETTTVRDLLSSIDKALAEEFDHRGKIIRQTLNLE